MEEQEDLWRSRRYRHSDLAFIRGGWVPSSDTHLPLPDVDLVDPLHLVQNLFICQQVCFSSTLANEWSLWLPGWLFISCLIDVWISRSSGEHFLEVSIPEDAVIRTAKALSNDINRALSVLRDIASGREFKKFVGVCILIFSVHIFRNFDQNIFNIQVILGLWILSIIGSKFSFLTLFYIGKSPKSPILSMFVPLFNVHDVNELCQQILSCCTLFPFSMKSTMTRLMFLPRREWWRSKRCLWPWKPSSQARFPRVIRNIRSMIREEKKKCCYLLDFCQVLYECVMFVAYVSWMLDGSLLHTGLWNFGWTSFCFLYMVNKCYISVHCSIFQILKIYLP